MSAQNENAQNENVLNVPSRNVLLTGSVWRGGFRNTSHDAAGPRPAGRIEESQERRDHTGASGPGDWPERAARSATAEEAGRRGRWGDRAWVAGEAIQPQTGREGQAGRDGDIEGRDLFRLWPDTGGGISGQQARHSRGTRNRAELDDRRQALACQAAAHREDPRVAATPVAHRRTGPVGHQRARLAGEARPGVLSDQHDRRCIHAEFTRAS